MGAVECSPTGHGLPWHVGALLSMRSPASPPGLNRRENSHLHVNGPVPVGQPLAHLLTQEAACSRLCCKQVSPAGQVALSSQPSWRPWLCCLCHAEAAICFPSYCSLSDSVSVSISPHSPFYCHRLVIFLIKYRLWYWE